VLSRLATLTYTRPKLVLAAVGLFVVAAIAFGGSVAERLAPAGFSDPDTDALVAQHRGLAKLGYDPKPGLVVVASARGGGIAAPAARAEVARLARILRSDRQVGHVATAFDPDAARTGGRALISSGGRATALLAYFRFTDETGFKDVVDRLEPRLRSDRLKVRVGGFGVAFDDVNETVREDLVRAELIAFPVLAVLLMLVFRGLVAALIPLVIGGIAVTGTYLGLRVLNEGIDVSIFALNIATAIGLGLAVDYGLLIVSRYREELQRSGPGPEAHRTTVMTAGRAVLYSGLTVAAALAALVVLPQRFLYSMGAGGAIVAVLAVAAALLATPALLALLGERVNALGFGRPAAAGSGRWYRLAEGVMRRPLVTAVLTTALLLAIAFPITTAQFTMPASEAVPNGRESREVSQTLGRDFTRNLEVPMFAVVRGSRARVERLAAELARVRGIARAAPPQPLRGGGALLQAIPRAPPLSEEAQDTVRRVRHLVAPAAGVVGGQTAELIDLKASLLDNAPLTLALIAVTTMVLLFLMTGSIVLPVKTLLMNVLSILAALGLLVLAFQEGLLSGLFGYDGPEAIETSVTVVLAATTFGLATDYAVLVLSRIKEYNDQGLESSRAIALGIERTGRVITAAALLLAVVFLAFTTSSVYFMKQVGFGQAVAVAIDASIVRALLVPALMRMLGRWNWWSPRPLVRLRERLGFSDH
jgi:putative drug exporter of the RND superfamily